MRAPSLRWRLFLTSSITVTVLFGVTGWFLQRYALHVADENVRTEIRGSIQAYEAVWKARTQVLTATTALMSSMSDVRAAFMTRDPQTIRDSADYLWSRVSDTSAVFLVLSPPGELITSLGQKTDTQLAQSVSVRDVASLFPKQLAGYVAVERRLYYVVLTPVYVQTSSDPVLLNVLCAGFRIDEAVAQQLRSVAPGSEFSFLDRKGVFASTLERQKEPSPDKYVFTTQSLPDLRGRPVAELRIFHSYDQVQASLSQLRRLLAIGWFATIAAALLLSSYLTQRLLAPLKALDHAAAQISARNYDFRVHVTGNDELSRFADTFNEMCASIQQSQADLLRQEQISTIGRLGSSLVHDLRNPLAAIYGGAEMLVDSDLDPEQTKRIATSIYKASQRIQELLQDLLSVSRGVKPNLEICRVRDMIEAARESALAGLSDTRVEIEIAEEREVVADRPRIERVFANLLANAEEAMTDSGQIRIYERESNNFLDVYVQDSGAGVPAEIQTRLFEPFVTGKRSGLGLGLAFSRRAMRDLGGDLLLLESDGPGACFVVRFPRGQVSGGSS